jgi:hypothetical protein
MSPARVGATKSVASQGRGKAGGSVRTHFATPSTQQDGSGAGVGAAGGAGAGWTRSAPRAGRAVSAEADRLSSAPTKKRIQKTLFQCMQDPPAMPAMPAGTISATSSTGNTDKRTSGLASAPAIAPRHFAAGSPAKKKQRLLSRAWL